MDTAITDIIQILLSLASIVIFSYVLLSSKTVCLAYRSFVQKITIAFILFAITEFGEIYHMETLHTSFTLIAWIIIIYALFTKLSSLTFKNSV